MKKPTLKQKIWLDKRSRKILKLRSSRKTIQIISNYGQRKTSYMTAPENLSLINNPEETIKYFNDIIDEMGKTTFDKTIVFDMKKVQSITPDAVMYILALLKNIKLSTKKLFRYSFWGAHPENEDCELLLKECGFYNYVQSADKHLYINSNKIQIMSGKGSDPVPAREICDFMHEKCDSDRIATKPIYETIIELMTNTKQHAYANKSGYWAASWYIFVENKSDRIQIVFLDTGEGIPRTIKKRLTDAIIRNNKESKLILSAIKGEYRSETKKKNRGKGLKMVYDYCLNSKLSNLLLVSGSGSCDINSTKQPILCDFDTQLYGTLFHIDIDKIQLRRD